MSKTDAQQPPPSAPANAGTNGDTSAVRPSTLLESEERMRLLTAYARADDRRKALIAGFQNHAAKPVEPQELLMVIANLAGRYM